MSPSGRNSLRKKDMAEKSQKVTAYSVLNEDGEGAHSRSKTVIPTGWQDSTTGNKYYTDTSTGDSQWERPPGN